MCRASTALEILTLYKIKSVARIQAPFFRVETKVSLEPPTEQLRDLSELDNTLFPHK